uniref:Proline-serine-threonine phosphatase-interacting protein 2 n=1 Tax=Prolemur simus TaxID=1328070 RepID=A0A8C9AQ07_PROSS
MVLNRSSESRHLSLVPDLRREVFSLSPSSRLLASGFCSDILSTIGYDNIIQHLNNGRKNCKEFEDFLKERAAIEEKYGKDLLSLSRKKPCGQSEINTLKRALEVFKQQVDNVAQYHIQLAQTLREEARKMEEFREKQKLQRKKTELVMDAVHKQKSLQFKKTMDAKKIYEQKCRDKDEAEQAVNRSANLVNPKQQEKLFVKLATSKTAVEDSDKAYLQHVNALEKIREEWQSEHIKACEVFEAQECERINFFRNALWLHVNQLSQQCVTSDEVYEKVRKSLEMCSIEKDIEYFVNQRKTGQTPPAPIMYENFYCPQRNAVPPGKASGPNLDPDYSTIGDYSLLYQ